MILRAVMILLVWACVQPESHAHPLAPTLLEMRASSETRYDILWKTSLLRVPGAKPAPVLPPSCRALTPPVRSGGQGSLTTRWSVSCGPEGLVGERIGVAGLDSARIDALLRLTLPDGRVVQRVLRANDPFTSIPAATRSVDVLRDYLRLGAQHILTGPDHLLFVFGLLLLVGSLRLLIQVVTAFTLGHSVTLSLAVLGVADFPSRAIEVAIALSVFVLAVELARGETAPPTRIRRFPWAMALGFGLLHGLGFAGALSEVGLPSQEIPLALFSFNLGIELGQLLFIGVVLAGRYLLRARWFHFLRWAKPLPVYAMGSLAAFWCFERAAALLG